MKIFGLNILTDRQLELKTKNHWENILKVAKLKNIYTVEYHIDKLPKCEACDKDRKITVKLPDGSETKIKCSCDKEVKTYVVNKYDNFKALFFKKGVAQIVRTSDWDNEYRKITVLCTKKDVDEAYSKLWWKHDIIHKHYYTTKELAKYAISLIKDLEK